VTALHKIPFTSATGRKPDHFGGEKTPVGQDCENTNNAKNWNTWGNRNLSVPAKSIQAVYQMDISGIGTTDDN
jgi:hypothetical protein